MYYVFYEHDVKPGSYVELNDQHRNISSTQFITNNNNNRNNNRNNTHANKHNDTDNSKATFTITRLPGRTLVESYGGQVGNTFHAHNDLLLVLFQRQRWSQSDHLLIIGDHGGYARYWFNAITRRMFSNNTVLTWRDGVGKGDVSNKQMVCFDEVVLLRHPRSRVLRMTYPFYHGIGRTNPVYSSNLFRDYFDFMEHNFGNTAELMEQSSTKEEEKKKKKKKDKPMLTWVSRGPPTNPRSVVNEDKILQQFQTYFRVQKLSFDNSNNNDDGEFQSLYRTLQQTNVLIGLHGAGLANVMYLPHHQHQHRGPVVQKNNSYNNNNNNNNNNNHIMFIEIRSYFGSEKRLFLNMANRLDIPYYAFDAQPFSESPAEPVRFNLKTDIPPLVEQVWDRWKQQQKQNNPTTVPTTATGECEFPEILPRGQMSTFEQSRCYLSTRCSSRYLVPDSSYQWMQLVSFHECITRDQFETIGTATGVTEATAAAV